jgi:hypothetical protein
MPGIILPFLIKLFSFFLDSVMKCSTNLYFHQKQGRIYQGLAETLLVDTNFSESSTQSAMN